MKNDTYDFVCPACGIIDRFGDKWSLRVLVLLDRNTVMRFNEIEKSIEGISQKMLTSTLKTLEAHGLIHRKVYAQVPPKVEYRLSALGESLMEPLKALIDWTLVHADEIIAHRNQVH